MKKLIESNPNATDSCHAAASALELRAALERPGGPSEVWDEIYMVASWADVWNDYDVWLRVSHGDLAAMSTEQLRGEAARCLRRLEGDPCCPFWLAERATRIARQLAAVDRAEVSA